MVATVVAAQINHPVVQRIFQSHYHLLTYFTQKGIAPGVGKAKLEMVVFAAMLKDRGLQKFSALKFVSRNVDGQLSNVQRSVTGANMSDIQSHTSTCTMASANCSSAPTNAVTNTK